MTWLNRVGFAFGAPILAWKIFVQLVLVTHAHTESLEITAPTTHPEDSGTEWEDRSGRGEAARGSSQNFPS